MDWEPLGTGNTMLVCGQTVGFTIRATIEYDCPDCPTSVVTKHINTCFISVTCSLVQIFQDGEYCLQWSYQTQNPAECDYTATLTIYEDGIITDTIDLIIGQLVCPVIVNAFYILEIELVCDGCEFSTMCTFSTEGAPPPTCDNFPELNCVPQTVDGVTCFTFTLSGSMTSEVETFIVTVNCDGMIFTWLPGDPCIPCTGTLVASALVFFCDCPQVCTPETSCEGSGCTVVSAGTPTMFIACS
jgi:hypothetical protein